MGCTSSKEQRPEGFVSNKGDVASTERNLAPPPDMDPLQGPSAFNALMPVGGPLTAKEYRDRIQTSGGTRGEKVTALRDIFVQEDDCAR